MRNFLQSSFLPLHALSKITTWNKFVGACVLLLCARVSCSDNSVDGKESRQSRDIFNGLRQSPITRIHRISNGRLNSRFLRTFPSLEFLDIARREGQLVPDMVPPHAQRSRYAANSPVFYIRLPPAPYILVPGLGYVSPHPYNPPMISAPQTPVMMSPMGMMMNGMEEDASYENSQNNVISLPLKFLSNGRPAQIQNPSKKPPKRMKPVPSKTTTLISGGKYSFNGRPNGVFIVRSPIDGSPNAV